MKISALYDVIDNHPKVSGLTREKLLILVDSIVSKKDIIKINDCVHDLYLNMYEVLDFLEDDIDDTEILLNTLFDLPEVKDAIERGAVTHEVVMKEKISRGVSLLVIVSSLNLAVSILNFITK